ncbi:hypothetical protein [Sulfobacillus harzensis]|uniref:Uncharacterized protein n=1 Tax=Sulfobacillus harzensis TaxID=2729629 RepID=A0A7Y0L607_9FIRM|nr:hypothetical protein [Sulfobacillus harzensis]NMP23963.1 hypothetical protein [Sulfobacillus harzensis]
MNHHIIPIAILGVGLVGTGVGLARQTHQQHLIDQDSRRVVSDLSRTRGLTASVVTHLKAIQVMNENLATINGRIARVNHNLLGEAGEMSAILQGQNQIWATLARLNQGLNQTSGALRANQSSVGETLSYFQSAQGLVPVTEKENQLVQALTQSSAESASLLRQMANKLSLLGTVSRTLP